MNKKIIVGLMSLLSIAVAAQKNVIDEVIWVVGDEAILRSDVENRRLFMQQERQRFDGDPYCFIPEQIAIQKLFLTQAKIDSIYADEGQVIQYVDRWTNMTINQMGSREKMEEYFGKRLSQIKEDQKRMVRDNQVMQEMQKKIVGDIKLAPSDVRRYFSKISADSLPMIPTTVEVQIITLEPPIPLAVTDEIKARLRSFTDQINKGERTFSSLALLYSEDMASSLQGGETGFMSKIELDPAFATAAFALNDPSRISNVVESEYGFHIIQLIEKRGDRINVRHILLRPKVSDEDIKNALAKMDTLYTDIQAGKISFDDAATYVSFDKNTRNNKGLMVNQNEDVENNNYGTPKFEMQELPQGVGVVIDKMEVGEISKPFNIKNYQNKNVVAIVKLKSRINAHLANVSDDFQELKMLVEGRKRQEVLDEWIKEKQKSTFIRIADGWRECDFQYPGWIKE
ncbi:MAG: peptidylprolyl isomerase [Tannerella sp.]|jgi:peptidyl-prolyl cis-trans isomerase SurA|nr:peptidylprolyl isomerase [Tannerella sp.]